MEADWVSGGSKLFQQLSKILLQNFHREMHQSTQELLLGEGKYKLSFKDYMRVM
jgi:hypothetical protein